MLISATTHRDCNSIGASTDIKAKAPLSWRARCRFGLGVLRLAFDVWCERRALLRFTAQERYDIGRAPSEVEIEARRRLFDLPAQRLAAVRRTALRGA